MMSTSVQPRTRRRSTERARSSSAPRPAPAPAWRRAVFNTVLVTVALVVLLDLVSGPAARAFINSRLEKMPDFTGHVGHVKLSLWRGRCEIDDAVFTERGHAEEPPFAHLGGVVFNVAYASLLHGPARVKVEVKNPEITVVKTTPDETNLPRKKSGGTEGKKDAPPPPPASAPPDWRATLAKSFPIEITDLEVTGGKIRFLDRTRQPNPDVSIEQFHLSASDLLVRSVSADAQSLPTKIDADGVTSGGGRLTLHVQASPFAPQPLFKSQVELRAMSLPALNAFLLAAADADVSRGTFEFEAEIAAANGAYEGYIKPFFKDLDFKTPSDRDKNAAQLLKKKIISATASLLKNDEEKKVATKAPFSGNFADTKVDVWTTIANLLRNAFVQSLREGFEGQTAAKAK